MKRDRLGGLQVNARGRELETAELDDDACRLGRRRDGGKEQDSKYECSTH
jgi:hypothetical protein